MTYMTRIINKCKNIAYACIIAQAILSSKNGYAWTMVKAILSSRIAYA